MAYSKTKQAEASRRSYLRRRSDPALVEEYRQRSLEYRRTKVTSEYRMLCSARSRAKKNGLDIDIDISDIVIPSVCPLLGCPIIEGHLKGKPGPSPNSPSLDRIDPALGYVKGNVWVISHRANVIKQNASPVELETLAKNLRDKLCAMD